MEHTLAYTTTITGASLPSHALDGDVGIDITALEFVKKIGSNTYMYDTGICIRPPTGFYTELLPRSSIVKSGYMLSNSVGILDSNFRGSIKIVLTKVDPMKPDLVLPFTMCQLILRPVCRISPLVVEKLDETVRGSGEFGSTG